MTRALSIVLAAALAFAAGCSDSDALDPQWSDTDMDEEELPPPDVMCAPGELGCECAYLDLDGDGRTAKGGECYGPACVGGMCV